MIMVNDRRAVGANQRYVRSVLIAIQLRHDKGYIHIALLGHTIGQAVASRA